MDLVAHRGRGQAAIDFLMSYGIALLAISITLVIIYKIGTSPFNAPNTCTPEPGWTCSYLALNYNGILNITLAQASGSPLTLTAIACSSEVNGTGNKPEFGNIQMNSLSKYYPTGTFTAPNVIYSGTSRSFELYCYDGSGVATGISGQPFTGYVWVNYSTPYLGNQIVSIVSFDTKFT